MRRTVLSWILAGVAMAALADSASDLAQGMVAALTSTQQRKLTQTFDSDNRKDWHYVPRSRRGLPLAAMNAQQKAAFDALLRDALSPRGYEKATGVVELEPILGRIEGSSFRDPGSTTSRSSALRPIFSGDGDSKAITSR